ALVSARQRIGESGLAGQSNLFLSRLERAPDCRAGSRQGRSDQAPAAPIHRIRPPSGGERTRVAGVAACRPPSVAAVPAQECRSRVGGSQSACRALNRSTLPFIDSSWRGSPASTWLQNGLMLAPT